MALSQTMAALFKWHWRYKYLLDLDGAGFSGRFLPFLQSRSLVIKTALFREWYDDRLRAWAPFVPLDLRGSYFESKTANIWIATEIDRRFAARGLRAWAVHPGVIDTSLSRSLEPVDFEGFESMGIVPAIYKSVAQGAATQVWCATARELEGRGWYYCSDCGVAKPAEPHATVSSGGYGAHAYDGKSAARLWALSLEAVGLARGQ